MRREAQGFLLYRLASLQLCGRRHEYLKLRRRLLRPSRRTRSCSEGAHAAAAANLLALFHVRAPAANRYGVPARGFRLALAAPWHIASAIYTRCWLDSGVDIRPAFWHAITRAYHLMAAK